MEDQQIRVLKRKLEEITDKYENDVRDIKKQILNYNQEKERQKQLKTAADVKIMIPYIIQIMKKFNFPSEYNIGVGLFLNECPKEVTQEIDDFVNRSISSNINFKMDEKSQVMFDYQS